MSQGQGEQLAFVVWILFVDVQVKKGAPVRTVRRARLSRR